MILVDTSVWIDFFADRDAPHVEVLDSAIRDEEDLALCGIILTEILQGIPDDRTFRRVLNHLEPLLMLPLEDDIFVSAAQLYRGLRRKGVTIRSTNDCVIAAVALAYDCQLLHHDRDFDLMKGHLPLRA